MTNWCAWMQGDEIERGNLRTLSTEAGKVGIPAIKDSSNASDEDSAASALDKDASSAGVKPEESVDAELKGVVTWGIGSARVRVARTMSARSELEIILRFVRIYYSAVKDGMND